MLEGVRIQIPISDHVIVPVVASSSSQVVMYSPLIFFVSYFYFYFYYSYFNSFSFAVIG